jgi:hypothetical protein
MKYTTYIYTVFDTEIEKNFSTKKDLLNYLKDSIWSQKMESQVVIAFKNDKCGNKDYFHTKYSFDNR